MPCGSLAKVRSDRPVPASEHPDMTPCDLLQIEQGRLSFGIPFTGKIQREVRYSVISRRPLRGMTRASLHASNDPNSRILSGRASMHRKSDGRSSVSEFGSSAGLHDYAPGSNAAVTISSDRSTSSGCHRGEFAGKDPGWKSILSRSQFTPNASVASGKAGFISNAANSPTVAQLTGGRSGFP